MSYLILPPDERDLKSEVAKPTFDFAGAVTGVTGLVSIQLCLEPGGSRWMVGAVHIQPSDLRDSLLRGLHLC